MKEIVTFEPVNSNKIILPIHYNYLVQAMIYKLLKEDLSEFLHEKGFQNENRAFKMFTFSRILGKYSLDSKNGKITFTSPVKLIISSHFSDFSNSIGNSLLAREEIRLGNNYLKVKQISVKKEKVSDEKIRIRTLSPISTYSTLSRKDGKRFTYYYNPIENDFAKNINNNLKNKYKAYYSEEPPEGNVDIEPIGDTRLSIVKYKGFVIKGYTGNFNMAGPIPLLQLGINTGLGSKNSQGFGCVRLI